jgi:Tfp pilus assembly protein PilN
MINLMPPEIKKSYYYAEKNDKLIKLVLLLIIGLLGVGIIGTYGWVSLHRSINSQKQNVAYLQTNLQKNNLVATENQVTTISNDFSLVVKVLSQEVVFSKLLTQMAGALPSGVNLTNLTINNTTSGSGLDITAEALNYNLATQVQVNLADPANGIFSKVDIVNISCNSQTSSGTVATYPCIVNLRAEFAKNNQFLFINQGTKK